MNSRKIKNLGGPTDDGDVTNKKYVDTENAKQDIAINDKASKSYVDGEIAKVHIDTTPLLPRDGSRSMFDDLDIGGNNILSVENLTDYKDTDPYDYRVKDVKSVVNKEYLNEKFMKKVDKDGREYYDLKGNIIRNCEPYYDGLFTDNDLVSKKYVDKVVSNVSGDLPNFLRLDGSKPMAGNIDMGGFTIKNVKPFVEDDSSQAASDAQRNEIINFGYFKDERGDIMRQVTELVGDCLPKDGSERMEGTCNIDMNNNNIVNLKDPTGDTNATNKRYVNTRDNLNLPLDGLRSMQGNLNIDNNSIINLKDPQPSDSSYAVVNGSNVIINGIIDKKIQESEERSIQAVQQENVFEKVMVDDLFILDDDDIKKVAVVDKDFHKVNQQTYLFKIDYDSEIGYYSTRLNVNVVYLPIGYYTIVFEMYCSDKIDQDKITINALSGTLSVSKINTKLSSDRTWSVINFYKAIIYPSDDELDIDIALKNKVGQSYEADTQIFVVVYGVAGTQNDVDTRLWDRYFYVDDKKIHFEAPIDMVNKDIENVNNLWINNELNMNNRQIKNLGDGNENS